MNKPTLSSAARPRGPLLSLSKKLLVVTGGASFMGRNLVAALNERGEENILIVDRLGPAEKWKNLLGLRFDDLIDPDEFRTRLRDNRVAGATTVFHCGWRAAAAAGDADQLVDLDYHYARELCEWCLKTNTRFIYTSSAETYGAGEIGFFDRDDVTARLRPLSAGGFSKHLFDLWALHSGALAKIAGLKCFDLYGPHEEHEPEPRSAVLRLFHEIQQSGAVTLHRSAKTDARDGEAMRDFVHVNDAVELALFFHEHAETSGLFNCGTGQARTLPDVARAVFAALGCEPQIRHAEMPATMRAEFQHFTQADMTKTRAAGFIAPFTALEDGVRDYVQQHLLTAN